MRAYILGRKVHLRKSARLLDGYQRSGGSPVSGAHVRGSPSQVINDEGKQVVFASVPAEATSQTRQLRGVLHGLGATPATPVTILSDGADGPRSLGEAASPGPTHHVLDWFHLAMRVQHVAQAATSWPDTTETDRHAGGRLRGDPSLGDAIRVGVCVEAAALGGPE